MVFREGTILAASVCLFAAPAAAQETYRLTYVREPGTDHCPDEAAFRAAVTREVTRDPFRPDAPNLLTVILRRSEKNIRVRIVAKSASGSERTTTEHEKPLWQCTRLIQHAAFSAGMLIDPLEPAVSLQQPVAPPTPPIPPPPLPPPPPPPLSPPPPPPPSVPKAQTAPRPRLEPPTHLLVSFAGGGAVGSKPGLSPSLTLGLGVGQGALSMSAEFRSDSTAQRDEGPFRVYGSHKSGMVAPCWHVRLLSQLQLDRCVLLSVGWARSNAEHENRWKVVEMKLTFTWGVGVRGGLSLPLGTSWSLQSRLDVLYVPAPPVVDENGVEIWTFPHASAALQFGVAYAFGVSRPTAKPPPPPLSDKIFSGRR